MDCDSVSGVAGFMIAPDISLPTFSKILLEIFHIPIFQSKITVYKMCLFQRMKSHFKGARKEETVRYEEERVTNPDQKQEYNQEEYSSAQETEEEARKARFEKRFKENQDSKPISIADQIRQLNKEWNELNDLGPEAKWHLKELYRIQQEAYLDLRKAPDTHGYHSKQATVAKKICDRRQIEESEGMCRSVRRTQRMERIRMDIIALQKKL